MAEEVKSRTPTETMVLCLEDFGESEPRRVLVIYLTEVGDLCWSTNEPWSTPEIVGVLECVKQRVIKQWNAND